MPLAAALFLVRDRRAVRRVGCVHSDTWRRWRCGVRPPLVLNQLAPSPPALTINSKVMNHMISKIASHTYQAVITPPVLKQTAAAAAKAPTPTCVRARARAASAPRGSSFPCAHASTWLTGRYLTVETDSAAYRGLRRQQKRQTTQARHLRGPRHRGGGSFRFLALFAMGERAAAVASMEDSTATAASAADGMQQRLQQQVQVQQQTQAPPPPLQQLQQHQQLATPPPPTPAADAAAQHKPRRVSFWRRLFCCGAPPRQRRERKPRQKRERRLRPKRSRGRHGHSARHAVASPPSKLNSRGEHASILSGARACVRFVLTREEAGKRPGRM